MINESKKEKKETTAVPAIDLLGASDFVPFPPQSKVTSSGE